MIAKNAPRKANETPCTIGRRDPMVSWAIVASPEAMNAEEIRIAVWVVSNCRPGARIRGTAMVAPNMVSTCCRLRPTALGNGLGTSSRP